MIVHVLSRWARVRWEVAHRPVNRQNTSGKATGTGKKSKQDRSCLLTLVGYQAGVWRQQLIYLLVLRCWEVEN